MTRLGGGAGGARAGAGAGAGTGADIGCCVAIFVASAVAVGCAGHASASGANTVASSCGCSGGSCVALMHYGIVAAGHIL